MLVWAADWERRGKLIMAEWTWIQDGLSGFYVKSPLKKCFRTLCCIINCVWLVFSHNPYQGWAARHPSAHLRVVGSFKRQDKPTEDTTLDSVTCSCFTLVPTCLCVFKRYIHTHTRTASLHATWSRCGRRMNTGKMRVVLWKRQCLSLETKPWQKMNAVINSLGAIWRQQHDTNFKGKLILSRGNRRVHRRPRCIVCILKGVGAICFCATQWYQRGIYVHSSTA